MIWVDNIYDLQYYKQPKGVPCYCELVVLPSDMYLQGLLSAGNGNYSLKLYVYSADGQTLYEDATAYFSYFFGKAPNGQHFFTARLNSFSPAMCAHACYLIRAEVLQVSGSFAQVLFDKYTERYCQNECCDTARGITFNQVGFAPFVVSTGDPSEVLIAQGGEVSLAEASLPAGVCGEPLIRLISKFDCADNFSGEFYGDPDVVFSGTAFAYRKITTLRGRVVRRPREIKREISYNCRLQRVESTPQYLLEGYEYFPPWKMYEIEGQLHANHIYIDDFKTVREYRYAGGIPMRQVSKCYELFKLETHIEDCTQRQVFGCDVKCDGDINPDGSNILFAIPQTYQGSAFYSDQKELVAVDYEGLLVYFHSQDGVTDVQDVDISGLDCALYKAVSITGNGYIPTSIYYDSPVARHRIYGQSIESLDELCVNVLQQCARPEQGVWAVSVASCAQPVAAGFANETITSAQVAVNGYADWVEDEANTFASLYNNEVLLHIKVVNSEITEDPGDPETPVFINGQVIGVIASAARPQQLITISSEYFDTMPEGAQLSIDEYGLIRYTGDVTAQSGTNVTIELNNLRYNI